VAAAEIPADVAAGVAAEVPIRTGVAGGGVTRAGVAVDRREQRVEDHEATERAGGAGQRRLPQRLRIPPGGHRAALHPATGVVVRGVVVGSRPRLERLPVHLPLPPLAELPGALG